MLIIGVDPGISGAICFFENGRIMDVVEMPTMTEGKKTKDRLMDLKFITKFQKGLIKLKSKI